MARLEKIRKKIIFSKLSHQNSEYISLNKMVMYTVLKAIVSPLSKNFEFFKHIWIINNFMWKDKKKKTFLLNKIGWEGSRQIKKVVWSSA